MFYCYLFVLITIKRCAFNLKHFRIGTVLVPLRRHSTQYKNRLKLVLHVLVFVKQVTD